MIDMNIQEVLAYLPHRYPFFLIDRVLKLEIGKSLVAVKNVTINEHFFAGHFPHKPVMPGVLILEALAQASGILALKTLNVVPGEGPYYFYAGLDKTRFKRVVEPGDQLILETELLWTKKDIWKFAGIAKVDDHVVCKAEMILAKSSYE